MLRLLLSTLLLLTLIGCSHLNPETSPGEVKAVAFSQRGGAENPAQYTVAIVVNKRNDVLLSQVQRPQGWDVPFGTETPSAGENALAWKHADLLLKASKVSFVLLRDVLNDWFDVMSTGNWRGEDGYQFARVNWLLLNKQDIDQLWALRGDEGPSELFALKWAAACGRKQGDESPWQTVTRVAEAKLGVPREMLKEDYSWFNSATSTAYFRLRYTGDADDQFVFLDAERAKKRAFRSEEAWFTENHAAVRLVGAYLHVIEGVPTDQTLWLFRGK